MKTTLKKQSTQQRSLWTATTRLPVYPTLTGHRKADVCIIGAGISGLSTAYMLAKAGRSVIVLDDGPLADGMTAVTTAHLSNAIDDRYYRIERLHGETASRLVAPPRVTRPPFSASRRSSARKPSVVTSSA